MDIFAFRDELIAQYSRYIRSFIHIREPRISRYAEENLVAGRLGRGTRDRNTDDTEGTEDADDVCPGVTAQ